MSDATRKVLEQATRELRRLRAENELLMAERQTQREAIAVVGAACRLPGAVADLGALWQLLEAGPCPIVEIPGSRWQGAGELAPRGAQVAGLLAGDLDDFDARFFGIAAVEARGMDPQQRLALELAWECFEDAEVAVDALGERRVGVFVGVSNLEHRERLDAAEEFDAYTATGCLHSAVAGRVSHCLDLRGPSVTVDTACSSSLVAIDLAIRSLRRGECELALAGGVQVLRSPTVMAKIAKAGLLAGDGRCKTFDRDADGFVRSEGAGLLLLRRAQAARDAGDRILALLRGAAVNHDGRSVGLSVPNPTAQERLLRAALDDAGVAAASVSHVEVNGTATALGDPVEVDALRAIYGTGEGRCWLGAGKAQLGHMEAAAGVVGLLKVIASLAHDRVPAQRNLAVINPKLGLGTGRLQVAREAQPWPRVAGQPRRAGVSAFGIAGTNAHVIVEEAPEDDAGTSDGVDPRARDTDPGDARVLPISARDPRALAELVDAYAAALAGGADVAALVHGATVGRSHGPLRRAVVGRTAAQLQAALEASRGRPPSVGRGCPQVVLAIPDRIRGVDEERLAALIGSEPAFAAALSRCEAAIGERAPGWRAAAALARGEAAGSWALAVALGAALVGRGVAPTTVLGVGAGTLAAALLAGAVTEQQAAALLVGPSPGSLLGAPAQPRLSLALIDCPYPALVARLGPDGFHGLLDDRVREALGEGPVFVELGTQGELAAALRPETRAALEQGDHRWITALADAPALGLAPVLAALYEAGLPPRWLTVAAGRSRARLPRYPWQRERLGLPPRAEVLTRPVEPDHATPERATPPAAVLRRTSSIHTVVWQSVADLRSRALVPGDEAGPPTLDAGVGEASAPTLAGASWVLDLGDGDGDGEVARALAAQLGPRCVAHRWRGGPLPLPEDTARVVAIAVGGPGQLGEDEASLRRAAALCERVAAVAEAIVALGRRDPPQLWVLTRGAVAVAPEERPRLDQAAIVGAVRCLMHDHAGLRCATIDLDPRRSSDGSDGSDAAEARAVIEALAASDGEDQLALRSDVDSVDGLPRRFVARLVRERPPTPRTRPAGSRDFALARLEPGVAGLRWVRRSRPALAPDDVEIEVEAAGLNFLDVLLVLDALPGFDPRTGPTAAARAPGSAEPGALPPGLLGRECAGRISALGSAVEDLRVGDAVIAVTPGCFARRVRTWRGFVVRRPENLDPSAAASLPIASLTALHALEEVARLAPGERVLIHAAAGGVGQYAVQIAQRCGAEIFATAGSPAKRALLREQGITHVASSRDRAFVEMVRAATDGAGVDVVLNCLAGPLLRASLELVAGDGRFVEIGKRDYLAHARIDVAPLLRRMSWTLIDLDGLQRERPERMRALLERGAARWASGALRPITRTCWPIAAAADAFATMARGDHVGKLVLDFADTAALPVIEGLAGATVALTGSDAAAREELATALERRGARCVGEPGAATPSGVDLLVHLADMGEPVAARAVDGPSRLAAAVGRARAAVTDAAAAGIEDVVLSGGGDGVLGGPDRRWSGALDGALTSLAGERTVDGAGGAGVNGGDRGNGGDRAGPRCTTLDWGRAIAGVIALDGDGFVEAVEAALAGERRDAGVAMRFDRQRWRQSALARAHAPLVAALDDDLGERCATTLATALAQEPAPRRLERLRAYVIEALAVITGNAAASIGLDEPLQQLGVDSLMAVTLRNRIEGELGLTLSTTLIWAHPSPRALAAHLDEALRLAWAAPEAAPETTAPSAPPPEPADAPAALDKLARLLAAAKAAAATSSTSSSTTSSTTSTTTSASTSRAPAQDNDP